MLYRRNLVSLILVLLLLVQPVFATSQDDAGEVSAPTQAPDIISAVHTVDALPANWSPLSPVSTVQQWLLSHTTAAMYTLADDGSWTPVLASALPEDVTADYAGSYGIPSDARGGYAYRILLNAQARWDDGLMITADDYIFSVQKLLEDEENRQNWLFLANAAAVLSEKKIPGDDIVNLRQAGFSNMQEALNAGHVDFYVDTTHFWGLNAGWLPITDRNRLMDFAMPSGMDERTVTPAYLYARYLADGSENSRLQRDFIGVSKSYQNSYTMEDLGLIKAGSFELVLLLQEPLAPSALMQKLENLFLFRKSYWSKDYATSDATYCGYGPYRITSADSAQIILEPNEFWWGTPVSDQFHRIICRVGGKD